MSHKKPRDSPHPKGPKGWKTVKPSLRHEEELSGSLGLEPVHTTLPSINNEL